MSTPATVGPRIREKLKPAELSAIAFIRSERGLLNPLAGGGEEAAKGEQPKVAMPERAERLGPAPRPRRDNRWRRGSDHLLAHEPPSVSPRSAFSGVIGSSLILTPTASSM